MKNINNNIENEIKTKKNNIIKNTKVNQKYKCIFHFPLTQNDCINSIDIIDDKVVIGTIMGDVNLCRVDKNNLFVENKNKEKNNNSNNNISNGSIDNNKNINNGNTNINPKLANKNGIPCIQLKTNYKNDNYNLDINHKKLNLKNYINYKLKDMKEIDQTIDKTNDKTNDKSKEINKIKKIKLIKINNKPNDTNIHLLKSNKISVNNKINKKKILVKDIKDEEQKSKINSIRFNNTNIEDDDYKKESSDEDNNNINYNQINKDFSNIDIKKFPQITKLINKSNENIPCLEFDTDDKINISIGDFELICMENMAEFNITDKNSTYNYLKIKNYKSESQHLKHCDNCTCMMNSSNFLIIYTQFADFNSVIKFLNIKYKNRNLKSYKIISGKMEISNYCVPFDFDGDRFLFLDYLTKEKRKICIYYTISEKEMYEYNIEKDYGHISHMKIINKDDNKIFLCRNNNECEIHLIDDNFSCVESWKHIGNDTISSFVYIKESKITEKFKNKINSKRNKNIDIDNYDNYLVINNNKGFLFKNDNSKNKNKNKRNKKRNLDLIQGGSTIINININSVISSSNNDKINIKCLNNNTENIEKTPKNKNLNSLLNKFENSSKREFNYSDKILKNGKIDGIEIYKKFNEDEEKEYEGHGLNKKNIDNINTIDNENENNMNNIYYIITLDKNGNVNLYNNQKVKKIFNLYEIEDIEEIYKKKEFFSVGFPYYIIMNELYIAITTDHGLFVISNDLEE